MSNTTAEKKAGSPIPGIIIGLVLMFGGMYVSTNVLKDNAALKGMAEQGIPLDPGKTIATIGVFLILFPVINSFFFKPLQESIDARQESLENAFSEAEALRDQMARMKADYETRMNETEAKAREQIQNQIKEAQEMRAQMVAQANKQAEDLKARAMEDIERDRNKILTEVRTHVAELTFGATHAILKENLDNDRNRKLIDEFIEKAEVPSA